MFCSKQYLFFMNITPGLLSPPGVVSMTIPVYIAECSPADRRGILVVTYNLCITAGQFIAGLVAAAFSYSPKDGWR